MNPVPSPNIIPHPTTKKAMPVTANTTKFFARILTVFFARQNPDSRRANPAAMNMTRNAASRVHNVSRATLELFTCWSTLSTVGAASWARAAAGMRIIDRATRLTVPFQRTTFYPSPCDVFK